IPGGLGFPGGKAERFFDARRVWNPARHFSGWKMTHPMLDLPSDVFTIHTHILKNIRNHSVFQCEQAEEDVFRADKIVVKARGFQTGQLQSRPCARGKYAQRGSESPG